MERCPKCNHKYAKYPLLDENKKPIIKNFFKMDFVSILFIIAVVVMIVGYKQDVAEYQQMAEHPCEYCAATNCCVSGVVTLYDENNLTQIEMNKNLYPLQGLTK